MLKKLRTFAKAKKGAELVEIIFGVVISVALLAVAITFISSKISENTNNEPKLEMNGNGGDTGNTGE